MTLEAEIKAGARDLGFVVSGIAKPDSPPHYPNFLGWLEQGCHAGMTYMARPQAIEYRQDPHRLLEECQSVLCLALPYPTPPARARLPVSSPNGTISNYALLSDYHQVVLARLTRLSQLVDTLARRSVTSFGCVDTSPILEKDYAQHAGLGWIGRNSLLVSRQFGTWMFLSELLLDLPLQADAPYPNDACGDCRRCVMACPTKAIRPDRSVDARRCLSYLTIEHRGAIPVEFRAAMGKRIFGCDTCQVICPVNRQLNLEDFPYVFEPILEPGVDLLDAFKRTEAEFKQVYAETPVMRAKYAGFRRNVAIALGNSGSSEAIPTLSTAAAEDPDPVIREAAAWSLTRLA